MRPQDPPSSRTIAAALQRLMKSACVGDHRTICFAAADAMRALRDLPFGRSNRSLVDQFLADPMLNSALMRDDALGAISQAISSKSLEAAYRATTNQRRKFESNEIASVTQLFTPRWVVEFLLQNSLGQLWIEMHPDSPLRAGWKYLADDSIDRRVPAKSVREIHILDPACGTMNFGIVAIEMLDAMYREEFGRAPTIEELSRNLFGIDLDPTAIELALETLAIKLRAPRPTAEPWALGENLTCGDALFDQLPNHFPKSFDVVATNPPYLSARNLSREVVQKLKARFPLAWRDQYACFVDRAMELLDPARGRAGMLTMQSFMFTSSYEPLRAKIDSTCAIETIAHFGSGLFDVGNPGTLQTVGFVLRREHDEVARSSQEIVAIRVCDERDKCESLLRLRNRDSTELVEVKRLRQSHMRASSRGAWCYWLSDRQREVFASFPKLGTIAPPRQGLATTENARFVRFWWEVESLDENEPEWFPYVKSGRFRRWYESPQHRVNWQNDGAEIKAEIARRYPYLNGQWQWVAKNSRHYFKRGVTYSYLTSGSFSARLLDEGAIFDVAGSSLFPSDVPTMLAILNSSVARDLLGAINPTVNFQVGDLAELPIPKTCASESLRDDVIRAIDLTRDIDRFDETSPDFVSPMPWRDADEIWRQSHGELRAIEKRIDDAVCEMYRVAPRALIDVDPESFDRTDLARRWISCALNTMVASTDELLKITPASNVLLRRIHETLGESADLIDMTVGGIEKFLAEEFDVWHNRLYRSKPRILTFGSRVCYSTSPRDAPAGYVDCSPTARIRPARLAATHRRRHRDQPLAAR